ncbi:MAG: 1,4-dihydroxy-2-naphthoate polyprenyltransferase [Ilumatobacteraceae bacterium]|nr:1,4-dihydroxy-2-naphthoate polyprenyltransferase [Ilumatobacteraceae bacterium]
MNHWVLGARPRTLPAAVVPVAIGAAVAAGEHGARWWTVGFALVVSLALQVGVNFANDYSDGVRGTDDVRVGPMRLVASGAAPASAVKRAAFAAFGFAAAAGLVLAITTSWWLVAVGVASVLAGWFYTGGSHPYGYLGLGEVFVFVFFGLVATVGTTYVVLQRIPACAWWLGSGAGALACSLLVVNNLRDIPTDREVGKRTLAVRLGDARTRVLYVALVVAALLVLVPVALDDRAAVLVALAAAIVAVPPIRAVTGGAKGRDLIAVLGGTGKLQLAYGALVTIGLVLTA